MVYSQIAGIWKVASVPLFEETPQIILQMTPDEDQTADDAKMRIHMCT